VTSEALAADMLAEAMGAGAVASAGSSGWRGGDSAVGSSARGWEAPAAPVPPPPPPEFRLSAGDVDAHRLVVGSARPARPQASLLVEFSETGGLVRHDDVASAALIPSR